MVEIVWTQGACDDLQKVFEAFEDRRPSAGGEFVENIAARLELLKTFPRMNRPYLASFRKLRLMGNCGLFYVVESRRIVVHAIVDLRQDPATLRQRLLGP